MGTKETAVRRKRTDVKVNALPCRRRGAHMMTDRYTGFQEDCALSEDC